MTRWQVSPPVVSGGPIPLGVRGKRDRKEEDVGRGGEPGPVGTWDGGEERTVNNGESRIQWNDANFPGSGGSVPTWSYFDTSLVSRGYDFKKPEESDQRITRPLRPTGLQRYTLL